MISASVLGKEHFNMILICDTGFICENKNDFLLNKSTFLETRCSFFLCSKRQIFIPNDLKQLKAYISEYIENNTSSFIGLNLILNFFELFELETTELSAFST